MTERPKRIILFITDHQRADLMGVAGHPQIRTPNFDRLAKEGVLFQHAYCHAPLCVPARTHLGTGR